jgi:hypothetical protein
MKLLCSTARRGLVYMVSILWLDGKAAAWFCSYKANAPLDPLSPQAHIQTGFIPMSTGRTRIRAAIRILGAVSTFLTVFVLVVPAFAQSVVSTHSGTVYYFDGAAYLDNQPLESHLGKFSNVPQGGELRTAQGHAELLLTPGVFLRLGENSAVRMVDNELANTRVELKTGSAILDADEPNADTSVTLIFRDWQIHSAKSGAYRIDSDPPRLWVLKGDAEVAGNKGQRLKLSEGMDLPFDSASLQPEKSATEPADNLTDWANGRSDSIVADNTITQQISADPGSQTADAGLGGFDGFVYFPFLGVPLVGLSPSPYASTMAMQPGFYSMYLPGYTYPPVLLTIMGRGRAAVSGLPYRVGVSPVRSGVAVPPIMGGVGRPVPIGIGRPSPVISGVPRRVVPVGVPPVRTAVPRPAGPMAHPLARPVARPAPRR